MTSKISGDESSDHDKMLSTQSSSPEREKTDECQSQTKQSAKEDCCSKKGKKKSTLFGVINITPICSLYVTVLKTIFGWTKYYFYALVIVLYPLTYYRFFIRKGESPFSDIWLLLKMLTTAFFCAMAYWCHSVAGPPKDPGYMEWDHFRSEEYRIANQKDRQKWVRKNNGIEIEDEPTEVKSKDKPVYPPQCEKDGCLKVLGVHHCGKCNRCVYKMDHHCPWTNNCVGYMTLKPFILFLFYVSCLCFFTVGVMYRQAWVLRMQHISLVQTCVPSHSQLKYTLTMYYLNETERREVVEMNELEYQRQVQFEKENPDILSWAFIKEFFFNWQFTKFYFLYSWETFWDGIAIFVTFACGMYTLFLMLQTLFNARGQTSMIDDMKIKVYSKNRRKFRKEILEYQEKAKRMKTLTLEELCQLVFGESSLLCIHTYYPIYRKPRSIELASEEYLKTQQEDDKKFK